MGVKRHRAEARVPRRGRGPRAEGKGGKGEASRADLDGSPPPGQALTPKRLKPPKHKSRLGKKTSEQVKFVETKAARRALR